MSSTAVVVDSRFMDHDPGRGHPERPERIAVLNEMLEGQEGLVRLVPRPATADEITLVHGGAYYEDVARTRQRSYYAFDADTPVSARSFDTACLAAGGVLTLIDEVMTGHVRNGFAFVRPPGHHAEPNRAMGFCLFNNVAIGAAYLQAHHGLRRILIMDWDVHHGNGTQHRFERDPGVLYISTHQYPYYPGTGALDEVGEGDGEGYTVNLPFPAGFGDAEYGEAFHTVVAPIVLQYEPEFVLISAGFDPHIADPLAGMRVTEPGFAAMAQMLIALAERTAGSRCVAVLEGGYDLRALRDCSAAVLAELRGQEAPAAAAGTPSRARPLLDAVREIHRPYWRC